MCCFRHLDWLKSVSTAAIPKNEGGALSADPHTNTRAHTVPMKRPTKAAKTYAHRQIQEEEEEEEEMQPLDNGASASFAAGRIRLGSSLVLCGQAPSLLVCPHPSYL